MVSHHVESDIHRSVMDQSHTRLLIITLSPDGLLSFVRILFDTSVADSPTDAHDYVQKHICSV